MTAKSLQNTTTALHARTASREVLFYAVGAQLLSLATIYFFGGDIRAGFAPCGHFCEPVLSDVGLGAIASAAVAQATSVGLGIWYAIAGRALLGRLLGAALAAPILLLLLVWLTA